MHLYVSEIKKILERKQFIIVFLFLLVMVYVDFHVTCQYYLGKPLSQVPSAYDLIVIHNDCDSSIGDLFFGSFFFFLITAIIASDVFFEEKEMGIHNLCFTRISRCSYVICQAAALMTVVGCMIVFLIVVSQILALIAFPFHGYMLDDSTGYNSLLVYHNYILSGLETHNPYLNNFVYAILFGLVGAIFAFFSYALSFVHQLKRYVILIVPTIFYLVYTVFTSQITSLINNYKLFAFFNTNLLQVNGFGSPAVYIGLLVLVTVISVILIWRGLRNDQELL